MEGSLQETFRYGQLIFVSEFTGYLLNQEFLVYWQQEEQAAVPDDSRTNKVIILETPKRSLQRES